MLDESADLSIISKSQDLNHRYNFQKRSSNIFTNEAILNQSVISQPRMDSKSILQHRAVYSKSEIEKMKYYSSRVNTYLTARAHNSTELSSRGNPMLPADFKPIYNHKPVIIQSNIEKMTNMRSYTKANPVKNILRNRPNLNMSMEMVLNTAPIENISVSVLSRHSNNKHIRLPDVKLYNIDSIEHE